MPLGSRPEVIPSLCDLLEATWPDWYGSGGAGDARLDLEARAGGGLPFGWVAMQGDQPTGTVALTETSYGAEKGEGPWLAGLCVAAACRGRGIGSDLVAAVEAHGALYTTTREAAPIFERRGWCFLRDVPGGEGWRVYRFAGR